MKTRKDAEKAEEGFFWAIKQAKVWAPEPLWMALANARNEVVNAWWDSVPYLQVVTYKGWHTAWQHGCSYIARKDSLPGWYCIGGVTTRAEDFDFSAPESM